MTHLRLPKRALILVCILLAALAVLAGAGLLFVPQLSGRAFAAAVAPSRITCSIQPDAAHCNNADPVKQLCVTAETTTVSQNIVAPGGAVVGRVDRRFSPICHAWWGRVFDFRHLPGAFIVIQVDNTHYTLPYNNVAFSNMVFDPPNASAPAVAGTLTTNGVPDAALSATVPAVSIPAH